MKKLQFYCLSLNTKCVNQIILIFESIFVNFLDGIVMNFYCDLPGVTARKLQWQPETTTLVCPLVL